MFCKKCGKEIDDDSEFCVHCGATITTTIQKNENAAENNAEESNANNVANRTPSADPSDKYPMALQKGSVLAGQYVIDRPIGQGGFGITYVAEDRKNGMKVAVKEYFPETLALRNNHTSVIPLTSDRNNNYKYGLDCFLQEANTLAQFIDNDDIVRVFSCFEENGTAYFVMEYIEGVSLADYIKGKGGKISFEDACHILFPMMDALSAVHEKGIVHRDISPDNIFVTWEGHVKLIDFGAARYSIGDRSMSLDVILKHGFAPKEQYSRHGRQGAYTDIYALAATFYFAITGKKPQDSVDRMDKDLLISPSAAGAGIGPNAEQALLHAMAVMPENRFQKMGDFKQAMVDAIKADSMPNMAQNMPAADERTMLAYGATQMEPITSTVYGGPQQMGGMPTTGQAYPQQNSAIPTTGQAYPQQNVPQMNAAIPNTSWNDPSAVPQGEKKKSKMPLILIIAAAVTVVLIAVVCVIIWKGGSSDDNGEPDDQLVVNNNNNDPDDEPERKPTKADEEEDPTPTPEEEEATPTPEPEPDSNAPIATKGYLYETSVGSTYYYETVTNNTDQAVALKGNAIAYAADGTVLDVADETVYVLGPGETTVMQYLFYGVSGIDHVECQTLPSADSVRYTPIINGISMTESVNPDNVIVSCTNNSAYSGRYIQVYSLFFGADGKVVDVDSAYFTDLDGEIKPGMTITAQLDSDVEFDHAECYLTGYSDGKTPQVDNSVTEDDLTIKDCGLTTKYGQVYYFMIITNNSTKAAAIGINLIGYDSTGKAVCAKSDGISVLGAGETSVAEFSFYDGENIDHFGHVIQCKTDLGSYQPIIGQLTVTTGGTKNNVKISVANWTNTTAQYVRVYTLFYDAAGNLVYEDDRSFTDDNSEIKAGNTITKDVSCSEDYHHYEVYLSGYAKKKN